MSERSQFALLLERRFAPFFGVQFLGAFNDNVYKNALVILIAFGTANMTTLDSGLLVNLCAGLFILPYFLFSATAGQIADKYEKSRIIRLVKLAEIGIMAIGAAGRMATPGPIASMKRARRAAKSSRDTICTIWSGAPLPVK